MGEELTSQEWLEAQRKIINLNAVSYIHTHPIERELRYAYTREWFKKYPDYQATLSREHPERAKLYHARRRASIYGNTPPEEMLTEAEWEHILGEYRYRCAYCGCKLGYAEDELSPTQDHVIPLSRGGGHTKGNVVPACVHCNSVKCAKTPEEWAGLNIQ